MGEFIALISKGLLKPFLKPIFISGVKLLSFLGIALIPNFFDEEASNVAFFLQDTYPRTIKESMHERDLSKIDSIVLPNSEGERLTRSYVNEYLIDQQNWAEEYNRNREKLINDRKAETGKKLGLQNLSNYGIDPNYPDLKSIKIRSEQKYGDSSYFTYVDEDDIKKLDDNTYEVLVTEKIGGIRTRDVLYTVVIADGRKKIDNAVVVNSPTSRPEVETYVYRYDIDRE